MKRIVILLSCILSVAFVSADDYNALIVKLCNGDTNTYMLSENPKVTVPESSIVIKNSSVSTTYERSEVEKFYFEYVDTETGIDKLNDTSVVFRMNESEICISGLDCDAVVSVTTLDGRIVFSTQCDTSGSVSIELSSLKEGVYVLAFNGRSVKVRL